jgi:DNA polymerase I-like protein with 3'-5' exonuclease and polymerase domains
MASKVDFTKDVQRITDKIDTVSDGYSKITGTKLSSADTATRDNITKTLGLLGTFGTHLKTLSSNAKDADQIKAFVKNNGSLAESLITSIETVVSGDDYLGVVFNNAAVLKARQAVAARYQVAKNPYERGILLDEALKYHYTTASDSQKKLKDVFTVLQQSNSTLTSLVLNPTDEQLKAIHSEEFQNFRTVAQDVAGLIGQFAKF